MLEADRRLLKLGDPRRHRRLARNRHAAAAGSGARAVLQRRRLLAPILSGSTRRDLEGEPAGEVTGAEAANARYKLDQRTAKRVDPAKPAAAEQMAESATRPAPKPAAQPPAELTTADAAAPSIASTPQPTGAKPRLGLAGLREAARHRAAGR